jgi:hypothetical protein
MESRAAHTRGKYSTTELHSLSYLKGGHEGAKDYNATNWCGSPRTEWLGALGVKLLGSLNPNLFMWAVRFPTLTCLS